MTLWFKRLRNIVGTTIRRLAGLRVGRGVPAEPRWSRLTGDGSPYLRTLTSESYSFSYSYSFSRFFRTLRERVRVRERVRCDLARSTPKPPAAPAAGYLQNVRASAPHSHFRTFQLSHLRTFHAPSYSEPQRDVSPHPQTSRCSRGGLLVLLAFIFASVSSLHAQGDRGNIPEWKVDPAFKNDVFTFARVRYESRRRGWGGYGGNWTTDTPDADLNLSFRLQQMTSLKVNPQPAVVDLTQKNLGDYPFIYIVEPGRLVFRDDEVVALRNYLEKGGFLMIDDFWGENEWANIESEIKRVFPNREIVDLPLEHPIFHCVFDLKEKPQVPGIRYAERVRGTGITWERDDAKEVHYRAIFDNKGRMMVIICQNTDNGDGWEEEGSAKWYFDEFSEKKAYPLTINIIFYAMTH